MMGLEGDDDGPRGMMGPGGENGGPRGMMMGPDRDED